jgi:hypothetical protein
MAGNQNSGGYRPTAPQNNPANISATGGNGQSGQGQAARYIPGMAYGQGQATMQQQKSAPMAAGPRPSAPPALTLPNVVGLTEPTMRPEEPITAGVDIGAGPGSEALTMPNQMPNQDPDIEMVRRFLPAMEFWASQPGSSQATKDYVVYLRGAV